MFFNFSSSDGGNVGLIQCKNGTKNPAYLLFYNDVTGSGTDWNTIYYDETMTCEERSAKAELVVPLEVDIVNANEQLPIQPSAVPHYWYVVVASCSYRTFAASAKIEFYNAGWNNQPPAITYQFSFDDQVVKNRPSFLVLLICLTYRLN